jgi:hypothetical protein
MIIDNGLEFKECVGTESNRSHDIFYGVLNCSSGYHTSRHGERIQKPRIALGKRSWSVLDLVRVPGETVNRH